MRHHKKVNPQIQIATCSINPETDGLWSNVVWVKVSDRDTISAS